MIDVFRRIEASFPPLLPSSLLLCARNDHDHAEMGTNVGKNNEKSGIRHAIQVDWKHSSCTRARPIQGDVRCFQTSLVSCVRCASPIGPWMQSEHGETCTREKKILLSLLIRYREPRSLGRNGVQMTMEANQFR